MFRRILKTGKDARFDEIKVSFIRFFNTWTLQGLWVTFTLAAALAAITSTQRQELDLFALVGALVWGGQTDYEAYKQRTPVLIPRPPKSGSKKKTETALDQ